MKKSAVNNYFNFIAVMDNRLQLAGRTKVEKGFSSKFESIFSFLLVFSFKLY